MFETVLSETVFGPFPTISQSFPALTLRPYFLAIFGRSQDWVVSKRVVLACCPPTKLNEGTKSATPDPRNRNEDTKKKGPNKKERGHIRQSHPPFYKTSLICSSLRKLEKAVAVRNSLQGKWLLENRPRLRERSWSFSSETATAFLSFSDSRNLSSCVLATLSFLFFVCVLPFLFQENVRDQRKEKPLLLLGGLSLLCPKKEGLEGRGVQFEKFKVGLRFDDCNSN